MRQLIYIFIFGIVVIACQSQKITTQEQTSIIRMTIDSALTKDIGLNTNDYWIDFSKVKQFERHAINDFFNLRANFIKINSDSLLKNDSTWLQYGFLQKMLINFKKVQKKGDSLIIDLEKIKATDGSNGMQFFFKKENKRYKLVSSKITWIS
jgi:sporulation protein YlmC with PRC-barrel domain